MYKRQEKIHTAGLLPADMTLCVTDTRGSHSELTGEFAAIRHEMESVAACLGGKVLGQVKEQEFWKALPRLRRACGDRAVLRAVHYFEENARALAPVSYTHLISLSFHINCLIHEVQN